MNNVELTNQRRMFIFKKLLFYLFVLTAFTGLIYFVSRVPVQPEEVSSQELLEIEEMMGHLPDFTDELNEVLTEKGYPVSGQFLGIVHSLDNKVLEIVVDDENRFDEADLQAIERIVNEMAKSKGLGAFRVSLKEPDPTPDP